MLAEWRVFATAAEVAERSGRQSEGAAYRAHSAAVLARIASSMAEDEPLRRALSALHDGQMQQESDRKSSGERAFPAAG
jgi:hypothetical protein